MPDYLFTRDDIIANLAAVAEVLAADNEPQVVLVVVGGSFLALQGLRMSTADVDTVSRIEQRQRLQAAIEAVAQSKGLRSTWLNDRARPFAPVGLDPADCEVLVEFESLLVVGPPPDFVFLMKLFAARTTDYNDMVALWPECSFATAVEVVDRYRAAYPHEANDPYLVEYVEQIIRAAEALAG